VIKRTALALVITLACMLCSVTHALPTKPEPSPADWCGAKIARLYAEADREQARLVNEFLAEKDDVRQNLIAGQHLGLELVKQQAQKFEREKCRDR
jgi:hypothetical protein